MLPTQISCSSSRNSGILPYLLELVCFNILSNIVSDLLQCKQIVLLFIIFPKQKLPHCNHVSVYLASFLQEDLPFRKQNEF